MRICSCYESKLPSEPNPSWFLDWETTIVGSKYLQIALQVLVEHTRAIPMHTDWKGFQRKYLDNQAAASLSYRLKGAGGSFNMLFVACDSSTRLHNIPEVIDRKRGPISRHRLFSCFVNTAWNCNRNAMPKTQSSRMWRCENEMIGLSAKCKRWRWHIRLYILYMH